MNPTEILPPAYHTKMKTVLTACLGNNLHLADVNFTCDVYASNSSARSITLRKEDMSRIDDDHYAMIIDTTLLGTGQYHCRLAVFIPDNDCEDGVRPEVVRFPIEDADVTR